MNPSPPDSALPGRLREFHAQLPLAGDPPNALLSLPEDRLIYLAALLRDTPQPAPDLSLEEWRVFRDALVPHGVFPLLAYRLRSWPEDCRPPKDVTDYLDRLFLYAAARSMRAGRQIQAVVDALEAAGIPSVLLKGPALARTVYPHSALRQSGDIDLLVRPDDVLAAEAVLEGLGYVSPKKEFHISQHEYHHQVFAAPGKGLPLELHWALDTEFDLFPADWVERVLSKRKAIRADDLSCDTLNPDDHLLFLVFHNIFLHQAVRLDWVYDTALMISEIQSVAEWQGLIARSVGYHLRVPLELTAVAAYVWTRRSNLDKLSDGSVWPNPSRRELQLWRHATTRQQSIYSSLYLLMQGQPGINNKLRFGYRFIFPPAYLMARYRRPGSRGDRVFAYFRRWTSIFRYL